MNPYSNIDSRLQIFSAVMVEKTFHPAFFTAELYDLARSIYENVKDEPVNEVKAFQTYLYGFSKELGDLIGIFHNYETANDQFVRMEEASDEVMRNAFLSVLLKLPVYYHRGYTLDEFKKAIRRKPALYDKAADELLLDITDYTSVKKTTI